MTLRIKPLVWEKRDSWYAESPSIPGGLVIGAESGRFYPIWSMFPVNGYATLEECKAAGQRFHDAFLMQFLEEG